MGFSSEDRAAIIQRNYVTRVGYVGVSSVLFFIDAWCSQAFSKKDCTQDLAPISRPKSLCTWPANSSYFPTCFSLVPLGENTVAPSKCTLQAQLWQAGTSQEVIALRQSSFNHAQFNSISKLTLKYWVCGRVIFQSEPGVSKNGISFFPLDFTEMISSERGIKRISSVQNDLPSVNHSPQSMVFHILHIENLLNVQSYQSESALGYLVSFHPSV